ncbi:Cytochrome c, mono-and diheme variants [Methanolobus vulcani]|jgi:mono/diheme cytochrome c family protein|uniref:Cytochrome c, mono-and diheme variants n=1 Tax=Methanolobus vulcani TaxID=38026 RepID=A0A7Z7AY61_9EURY|nr:cytochrome c [Methanolobus vulcani]SDG16141.1 Cytochrome c, mono-and diheme variants [Methanolobus vulcani]
MEKVEKYFFALVGLIIVILLVVVISMMSNQQSNYAYMPGYNQPGGMMGQGYYGEGGMMGSGYYSQNGMMDSGYVYPYGVDMKTNFTSNGETIYYTGYNVSGQKIAFTYGPNWLYVHGGSCVNCHGVDGKGGVPVMMAYTVPADITYSTLTSGDEVFTDENIKAAIRDGVDPAGKQLDLVMPRWQMSDADLNDIIEYLKEI